MMKAIDAGLVDGFANKDVLQNIMKKSIRINDEDLN